METTEQGLRIQGVPEGCEVLGFIKNRHPLVDEWFLRIDANGTTYFDKGDTPGLLVRIRPPYHIYWNEERARFEVQREYPTRRAITILVWNEYDENRVMCLKRNLEGTEPSE